MAGRIRGVVGLAGCDNPRVPSQGLHRFLAQELIKADVLIVSTGCGSAACGTAGYLTPETALENAGPGFARSLRGDWNSAYPPSRILCRQFKDSDDTLRYG